MASACTLGEQLLRIVVGGHAGAHRGGEGCVDANPQAKPAALLLGHPAHTRDAGRDAMCIQESHSERQGQCCGRPRTPYTVRKPGRTVASGVPELVRGGSSARCFTFPLLTPHLPTCCASPPLCGPTVVLKTALQRNVWGENMSSKVYHEILQVRTLYSKNSPMSSWFGRRQEARSPERVCSSSAPHAVHLAAWVRARAHGFVSRGGELTPLLLHSRWRGKIPRAAPRLRVRSYLLGQHNFSTPRTGAPYRSTARTVAYLSDTPCFVFFARTVSACASVKSAGGQRGAPAESVGPQTLVPKIEALKAHIAQIRADLRTWDEKFVGELEKCLRVIVSCPPSQRPRAPARSGTALELRKDACFCVEGNLLFFRSCLFECSLIVDCGEDPCASIVQACNIAHVNNMMQACPACEFDVHAILAKRQQKIPLVLTTPLICQAPGCLKAEMSGVNFARQILLDSDEEVRWRHGEISVFTDASLVFFRMMSCLKQNPDVQQQLPHEPATVYNTSIWHSLDHVADPLTWCLHPK